MARRKHTAVWVCLLAGLLLAGLPASQSIGQPVPPVEQAASAETQPSEPSASPARDYPQAPAGARITGEGWFAPVQPGQPPPPLPAEVDKVYVIPLKGEITSTMADTIARKITLIRREGAQLVIFRIDSPGGEAKAMERVIRMILEDLADVRTVAYVDPEAYSAAAIIALACNEIVMAPLGNIGAAMPIMVGAQGLVELPEKERGKFESAVRSQVRSLAERNGYSQDLCEGMITITMELWLIRNRNSGELRIVEASQWRGRLLDEPQASQPARQSDWEYVRLVDGPMEVVTFTASEASFYGLSQGTYRTLDDVLKRHNASGPSVVEDVWSEKLVAFLTSPQVSGLLLMVGVICVYIELQAPGFGVAGGLALVAFALLFGSRYLIGMAAWWEVGLFVVGLALIAVEVFVLPGFGVAGILGILACVAGLLAIIIPNAPSELPIPRTQLDWHLFSQSLLGLCLGLIGAFIAIPLMARILPKVPLANRLILPPPRLEPDVSATENAPVLAVQVGQLGRLETPCRPAGKARFGDAIVDVTSHGSFLPGGIVVRVISRQGNQVVVEPAQPSQGGPA